MHVKGPRVKTTLLNAALGLTACATIGLGPIQPLSFDESDERASELRVLPPSSRQPLGGAALRIWARVQNPNSFGLTLTEVAGELTLEDVGAIAVEFPLGLPMAAFQDTLIPLDVTLGFDDVPRLGSVARAAIFGESIDYRIDGTFTVDAGALGAPRFGPWTLLEGEVRVR